YVGNNATNATDPTGLRLFVAKQDHPKFPNRGWPAANVLDDWLAQQAKDLGLPFKLSELEIWEVQKDSWWELRPSPVVRGTIQQILAQRGDKIEEGYRDILEAMLGDAKLRTIALSRDGDLMMARVVRALGPVATNTDAAGVVLAAVPVAGKLRAAANAAALGNDAAALQNHIDAILEVDQIGNLAPKRPVVKSPAKMSDRVTKELPAGQQRTPEENEAARKFFENHQDKAKKWWSERTGRPWPEDATHAHHPRELVNGGDPLFVEPGYGRSTSPSEHPREFFQEQGRRGGKIGGRGRPKQP